MTIPTLQTDSPGTRKPAAGRTGRDPDTGALRRHGRISATRAADLPPSWHLAANEQAADAIIVADLDGSIRYVNPAFERDAGRPRDAILGQDVRRLVAPEHAAATINGVWAAIRRGEAWCGELRIPRPDGTLAWAEASVQPVRDEAGVVVASVFIMRNTTGQRPLERQLDDHRRERSALAAELATTRAGDTAEATATVISLALLRLAGFGGVGLFGFEATGDVVPLAALDREGRPVPLSGSLPPDRIAYLRERASHGPWIEAWRPGPDHPYHEAGVEHEVRVLAYVPIRSERDTLGLLVVSGGAGGELDLSERLPALIECAAFAGALLGPQLRSRSVGALNEARIRAIIADRTFLPVFQPIVELENRVVVGYEALTRFADGSRPDEVFAEAARCGLAIELEAATLEAILDASGPLPASAWLNLNVSAKLVLAGEPLASILRQWGGQIVLELTEHIQVNDYPALRAELERLGPTVRLAVDDAGAGFASLRHILELRPDYVKLDRGIVRQIHRDAARQALVAGMVHFAGKTKVILVAEGVETEAEARQLQRLGVTLGQGYWLGRPALVPRTTALAASVARWAASAPIRSTRRRSTEMAADDDICHAVNIGGALAAALREVGVATVADLRALGAVAAWERLRELRPGVATVTTLVKLEGATRGIRISQLSPAERAKLRLFVRLRRQAS